MSDDETSFLRAILEAPDDHAPRLVYADWLEERGHAGRAEFLRVECRLARLPVRDPRRAEMAARKQLLLPKCVHEWLGPRVESYLAVPAPENPYELQVRRFASEHRALPLWSDIAGTCFLRMDGGFLIS